MTPKNFNILILLGLIYVFCGLISILSLAVGISLFIHASYYFLFFIPIAIFIFGYLLLSYAGVALWATKNFSYEEHT